MTAVLLALVLLRVVPLFFGHSVGRVNLRELHLVGLDGSPVPPDQIAGKALVVNFWAPWCPPCRIETPWLESLQKRDAGKLLVVGVVADPGEYAHAAQLMRRKGIHYLLVRDSQDVQAAFGAISVLPTSFYVAPSGTVVHSTKGLIPKPLMFFFARQAMRG